MSATLTSPAQETLLRCLDTASLQPEPYHHWLLNNVLPEPVCDAIRALPFDPPEAADTSGRRETHNSTRVFCGAENQARFPVMAELAALFQDPANVGRLERLTGATITGGSLRIEYCLDVDGFWLEPHTDIGVKLFTMLVYLSTGPGSENWGTDVLLADGTLVGRAPSLPNTGLIFVPGSDTWHGFAPRPIAGVRQSLIINYVKPEWRARHELCFPEQPVRGL